MELGSGCGLVGIAAGILGAAEVVLTDLEYTLPILKQNIAKNRCSIESSGCARMSCMVCDWFDPKPSSEFGFSSGALMKPKTNTIDLILVADCVWVDELVRPLLTTLKKYQCKTIISYQRRGQAAHDTLMNGLEEIFYVRHEDKFKCDVSNNLHIFECNVK